MGFCANNLGWGGWGRMGSWGHMGGLTGLGWLGSLFGLTVVVGLVALFIVGAIWLARRAGQQPATMPQSGQEPLAIARRRLAAGEITPAEFEELRDRLRG